MIDLVCTIHGKRRSEHACLVCVICYRDLAAEDCHVLPGGTREDVCNDCAAREEANE